MLYNNIQTAGGHFRPAPATQQAYSVPASVGGMNALDSVTAMAADECLYCHNLVPSEYGLRLRRGYREWARGLGGQSVGTIIPFEGQAKSPDPSKLFAATRNGIYDVTLSGTVAPVQGVAFVENDNEAGVGVFTEMTNDAGRRVLMYADESNGLYYYSEDTGLWTRPIFNLSVTPPAGRVAPVAADIVFVVVWKTRLWIVERGSGDAWYLQPSAVEGTVDLFNFGAKLSKGGYVQAIYNWTIDGGAGSDDNMVVMGSGGDVLIYGGLDPESGPFELIGSFFIGKFPRSRKLAIAYGGELYAISTYGVISIRQLLQGVLYEAPSVGPSSKINRYLREVVALGLDSHSWALHTYPGDGFMQIIAPYNVDNRANALQYQQNLLTQSWGLWRGVPIASAANWKGQYIIGTPDGRVVEYTGTLDEASNFAGALPGVAIEYDVLTSYVAPNGNPTTNKIVGFIRAKQITRASVAATIRAVYDYELTPTLPAGNTPPADPDGALWDTGLWDAAVWAGAPGPESSTVGTMGIGRVVAIAMRGQSTERLTFVAWDVAYTEGTFL